MEFTSWDSYLRYDELEHHGIPGMHWHQRRYQNEDGSLTAAGRARYGSGNGEGTKHTSARKMQRDFNNLDKGYANVVAEKKKNLGSLNRAMRKTEKYGMKKGYLTKEGFNKAAMDAQTKPDKKLVKLGKKVMKAKEKVLLNDKQLSSIENLQWRILAKAHENGYTASTKQVNRYGTTKTGRGIAAVSNLLVGGVVGGALAGAAVGASSTMVKGQKAKIRKNGDGSTRVQNYNQGQTQANQREQAVADRMRKMGYSEVAIQKRLRRNG